MQADPTQPLKLYYCSASEDETQRGKLDEHFAALRRLGLITTWHDSNISAGTERQHEIYSHVSADDIILLLISKDFLHNDHCYNFMQIASERHAKTDAYVFAILLQPVYGTDAILSNIPKLPDRPITCWRNRNQAYCDVVENIKKKVDEIRTEQWLQKGNNLYTLKQYDEAIAAYQQSFHLNPNSFHANYGMAIALRDKYMLTPDTDIAGKTLAYFRRATELIPGYSQTYYYLGKELCKRRKYEEALVAFDQAIQLDPNHLPALYEKGYVLRHHGELKDAITIFERIIQHEPTFTDAYESIFEIEYSLHRYQEGNEVFQKALTVFEQHQEGNVVYAYASYGKGWSLYRLGHDKEALMAFEQAIEKHPHLATPYCGKGMILCSFRKHTEALATFEQAIAQDAALALAYYGKGLSLHNLKRYEEALVAFEQAIRIRPNYGLYHYEKGWTLERMGELCQAMDAYREAQQLRYDTFYHLV